MSDRSEGQPSSFWESTEEIVMSESAETNTDVAQRVGKVLLHMKKKCFGADFALMTEGGESIPVHRCIMAASSPYFKALFVNRMGDSDSRRTSSIIPGVSYGMLWLIVHHAYSGETLVDASNVHELLPAADQFNMNAIVQDCIEFILKMMVPENCIGIRHFAKQYFCKRLEEVSHKFLMAHFSEVAGRSEELLDLPLSEAMALFGAVELNVSNEKIVWEAILRWIDNEPGKRKDHIAELLRCVRLGLLDSTYFMENVKVHKYVAGNDMCKPIVIETVRFMYELQDITNKTDVIPTPLLARPRIPNDIMFAIGGWSGGSPTNIMETYDTRADRWIQVNEIDPAGARAYHKCVVIGTNIYVVGGFNGNEYFNSCRKFNAVTKEWSEIAPMNTRRCYVSSSVIGSVIYAMGGYDGHHRQNTAEKYNIETNQWNFVAPMSAQRSDACSTVLGGRIYITGGFNGSECLNSCEFYDPSTNTWHGISPMRSRRSGVSCIAHGGFLYALGGFNGISRLQSGERYDPQSDQWTALPDMFNPRSNFAIEVMDDMIFVVGGFNGVTTIYHVECYDEKNSEWLEATDMNTYRSALAACVVKGLPNVMDYIHQNRENLMEEKRQKLLQMQQTNRGIDAVQVALPQNLRNQIQQVHIRPLMNEEDNDEIMEEEEEDGEDDVEMLQ